MATGNYLSEESAQEYLESARVRSGPSIISGIFMFFSSVLAALIPLSPYLLITGESALLVSATVSVLGLFILGGLTARFSRLPMFWRGVRMAVVGGLSIGLGILVGSFFPEF
jgi:VIT1/CCC1 family predicted Fe2+/Mn2+ transporter